MRAHHRRGQFHVAGATQTCPASRSRGSVRQVRGEPPRRLRRALRPTPEGLNLLPSEFSHALKIPLQRRGRKAAKPQPTGVRPSPGAGTLGSWRCRSNPERPALRCLLRPGRPHSEKFHPSLRTISIVAGAARQGRNLLNSRFGCTLSEFSCPYFSCLSLINLESFLEVFATNLPLCEFGSFTDQVIGRIGTFREFTGSR